MRLGYYALAFLLSRGYLLLVASANFPGVFDACLDPSDLAHFGFAHVTHRIQSDAESSYYDVPA
jgi:hypothetical protein